MHLFKTEMIFLHPPRTRTGYAAAPRRARRAVAHAPATAAADTDNDACAVQASPPAAVAASPQAASLPAGGVDRAA